VLPAFEVRRPGTLAEALKLLTIMPQATPIAGGTNLLVDIRSGRLTPNFVVDLARIEELCCIHREGNELSIGGAVTLARLLEDPVIRQTAPILAEMARSFANVLIRNRATVGGNLANAAPCADSAAALLVLDADVELASAERTRRVPLSDFFVRPFETVRQSNELLTAVRFSIPSRRTASRFEKVGLRKISCMAKVDIAVAVTIDEVSVCQRARIALGAASPIAIRATDAEATLEGQKPNEAAVDKAASLAAESIAPRTGSEYKRQVVGALARRLLKAALEDATA